MALFCVISTNSGSFWAHCVKVHVRYLISWWVLVLRRDKDWSCRARCRVLMHLMWLTYDLSCVVQAMLCYAVIRSRRFAAVYRWCPPNWTCVNKLIPTMYTIRLRRIAMSVSVCLYVFSFAYLKSDMSKLHEILLHMLAVAIALSFPDDSAIYMYVMYFRFCWWRHVCLWWATWRVAFRVYR